MTRSRSGSRRTLELTLALLGAVFNAGAMVNASAVFNSARAQDQRPLPGGGPDELVTRSLRVNVVVEDTLDPDRLRNLTRPNVTAWVHTRSNTLGEATLENLARFDDAFVELRAPIAPVDVAQFRRLPRVGLWLKPDSLSLVGALPGARRVAVQLGAAVLDEALLARLRAARPALVSWAPNGPVDLLQWSLFLQVPGRKVVASSGGFLLAVQCGARSARDPAVEVHVANLLALSSEVFPCGRGTRVVVGPEVERWLLQSLVLRDPSAELVVEVGADAELASGARRLLESLGIGPSR
jgi:hypothetical protein